MTALQTENVTVVLDCCHSGGAKRGNLQIRSVRGGVEFQASSEEKSYQQQWLSRLHLTPAEFKQRRQKGVAKGVVITATNRDQLAADYPFKDFSAGAFTYLMSQYFWQLSRSESIAKSLPNIARSTTQISFTLQTPEFEVKPGSGNEQKPFYFIENSAVSAEAIITQINGLQVQLWLGGIEPQSLSTFEKEAVLAVVDADNQTIGRVQLESRQGLIGRGKLLEVAQPGIIQPGALCLEQVRVLPNNLTLRIGLDASLSKDIAIARSTLSTLPRLEALPLQQGQVDCIFGRMTKAVSRRDRSSTTLPPPGSLGLFSPGLDAIPGSFGAVGETVIDAIKRLQAKFKSLLAGHFIKIMLNSDASRLNVTASLSLVGQENQLIAEVFPTRGVKKGTGISQGDRSATIISPDAAKLPLGTAVVLRITNNEPRNLYMSVLVIDAQGEITVVFPYRWTVAEDTAQVGAGDAIAIPDPNNSSFELRTQEPKGLTEVLLIASVVPLKKVLKTLQTLARKRGQQQGAVTPNNPIEVIDDLLADLGENSRDSTETEVRGLTTVSRISTTQFAAMSMTFEVI